jgi:hypothetical protein
MMFRQHAQLIAIGLFVVATSIFGCRNPEVSPHFTIIGSEVRTHSWGGPNYALLYEFDCRYETGERRIEIVETADGNSQCRVAFKGSGSSHFSLDLMGTFVNDGDTNRINSLKASLVTDPTWSATFSTESSFTFLSYTALDGRQISYSVRLTEEPQSGPRD